MEVDARGRALIFPLGSLIVGAAGIAVLLTALTCSQPNIVVRQGEQSTHHSPTGGFRNPYLASSGGFTQLLKWQLGLGPKEPPTIPAEKVHEFAPEVLPPDLNQIHHPDPTEIQITWIGHSSFLIQTGGINLLTDPIFSTKATPIALLGPKRLAPPGLSLEQLPAIHAVIVTHDHYDHLDEPTVLRLPGSVRYIVPLGVGSWLRRRGIGDVTELDWWDSVPLGPLTVHAVPAQHFSGRGPFVRNRTLWMGWVLDTPSGKVFFAGDTGYAPFFREIGRRFSPIRISFIPIGAYRPRWFMGHMHVDPPQAVRIHMDLRSERSVAMHWGTFPLADEPPGEPPVYLREALKEAGLGTDVFVVMRFGETLRVR